MRNGQEELLAGADLPAILVVVIPVVLQGIILGDVGAAQHQADAGSGQLRPGVAHGYGDYLVRIQAYHFHGGVVGVTTQDGELYFSELDGWSSDSIVNQIYDGVQGQT